MKYSIGRDILTLVIAIFGLVAVFFWLDEVDQATEFNARPQADCKSGGGCCRPRVQDTEDPKIECTDDDWRKP